MFQAEHPVVLYMRLGTHVSHVRHEEEVQLPVQTHAQIRSWFWPMILFLFLFFVLIYDLSSCHWEDWSVVFCREGGRTEGRVGARQGGVLEERRRDGGRNSLKSQSEV